MWENVARTEIASRYKIIQITFVDFMGFSLSSETFNTFRQRKRNKKSDLDDEWLRYFRG